MFDSQVWPTRYFFLAFFLSKELEAAFNIPVWKRSTWWRNRKEGKIAKCERSDWPRGVFAWETVNMAVTSRCLAFRTLITQAGIWKSFCAQNSTSLLYLPIPSSTESSKIFTNKLCQFLSLNVTSYARKIRILESIFFAKQELITRARPSLKDFATGKNFSFNQCNNKKFFSREGQIVKAIEKFFPELA